MVDLVIHPLWQKVYIYIQVANVKYSLYTAMLCDILSMISSLSKTFQSCDVDLSVLQPAVSVAIQKLEVVKTEPEQKFSFVLEQLDHVEERNENVYRDVMLKDNNLNTKQDVKSICCKFMTEICKKLNERFRIDDTSVLNAMDKLLNSRKLPVKSSDFKNCGAKYIDVLVKHYCNVEATNCTPFVDSDVLASEWKDCSLMMHGDCTIDLQDFCKLLVTISQYVAQYPNLVKIALVTLIVPVTSIECERSFLCQNRIKMTLRSR